MIHVDTRRLAYNLPRGWLTKAARAQEDLAKAKTPADVKKIYRNRGHWKDLNESLRKQSHGKCWYSEACGDMARMDVDHFRPKGTITEADGTSRPGYPFLAYDFRNYRLAAQLANQTTSTDDGPRGKYQQFPLQDTSPVASDRSELGAELPLLLDPTVHGDPELLTFEPDGKAHPSVAEAADPVGFLRARKTIEALWLDRVALTDARRALFTRVSEDVYLADDLMTDARTEAAAGHRDKARRHWRCARQLLERLRRDADPSSPYAATVQACLKASGLEWAKTMGDRAARRSLVLYDTPARR